MKNIYKLLLILSGLTFVVGCATMNRFFGPPNDVKSPKTPVDEAVSVEPDPDTYSKNTQMIPAVDRNYKRMTKVRMEEESDLQAGAGSLWVMEGQKSFLFAQNNKRREGDPTSLKVEGPAMKQVQLKINTIQDLLNDLEEQKRQAEIDQKKQDAEKKRLADIGLEKQKILDADNAPEEKVAQEQAEKIVKERKPAAVVEPAKVAKVENKHQNLIQTVKGFRDILGSVYSSIGISSGEKP